MSDTQGTLLLDFAHRPLSKQELDVAHNCVTGSKHTRLTLLPNQSLDPTGELEGFVFDCCADDPASVLPLTRSTFATTAMYECMADSSVFLHISSDTACATAELVEVVRSVEEDEAEQLKFDVMPDWNSTSSAQLQDQRPWRESVPAKIGVYHAFIRSTEQNTRKHKLFIVVSGHCPHASEELYNLWLDARDTITRVCRARLATQGHCAPSQPPRSAPRQASRARGAFHARRRGRGRDERAPADDELHQPRPLASLNPSQSSPPRVNGIQHLCAGS
jgi:hypothetical protein